MAKQRYLGKYQILTEIGQGGFGAVYKARDTKLNRVVALKVLLPQWTADPGFVEQFYREAQWIAQLDHPHIVTVYDVDEEQGQHFIAMQYVEGPSLDRRITRGQPWSLEQVLPLAQQIAAALDYAHVQGVLHLNLKPGNVLLRDDGHAWLTDFGLGRAVSSASQPASALSGGTAAYLSPEQADLEEPRRPITPLADIYAFGVLLYQLCTGRVPFEGNPVAVANAHVNQQPPRPTLLNDALSQAVEEVLLRALSKSPQARFPDAASLVQTLAETVRTGETRPVAKWIIAVEPLVLGDFRTGPTMGERIWPRQGSGCCAAARGSTIDAGPAAPTATGTSRIIAAAASGFGVALPPRLLSRLLGADYWILTTDYWILGGWGAHAPQSRAFRK